MPHSELINERLRFLEIDQDATKQLQLARKILEPEMDKMLEQFYSHILQETEVKALFANSESIERAREAQKKHWLNTLFNGKFKSAYFEQAVRIGEAHARIGLTPNWYIGGYCKMLVMSIQHISDAAKESGRDPSPTIEAVCKAVLLDLDLVIDCYLEAKDRLMLDLLARATNFSDDMEGLNGELGAVAAKISASTNALSADAGMSEQSAEALAQLRDQTKALNENLQLIEKRLTSLKVDDRLYLLPGAEHTSTFARLKKLVLRK